MERLYDYSPRGHRVANHEHRPQTNCRSDQNEKHLQSHPEPLAQALELEQLQIDDTLLVQVLGLDLDQMTLLAKISRCRLRQFRIVFGGFGGEGCSRGIERCRGFGVEPSPGDSPSVPRIPDTPPDSAMSIPPRKQASVA